MSSGDDIVAGQVTTCEKTTDVVGALPDPPNVQFNGTVIFRVGPQQGKLRPEQTLDGIYGLGFNGPGLSPGGTGVIGFGGPHQGTGVVGKGAGAFNGFGGVGVAGEGGNGRHFANPVDPGTGVIGTGGVEDQFETTGRPHGAGVLGIAGNGPFPSFMDSGSVGVFGQGGNADRKSVTGGTAGPKDPGIGVLGRGGTQSDEGRAHGPGGPGVVGVPGGAALPSMDDFGDTGVFGKSDAGRGGVFQSATIAQLRLVPAVNPTPSLPAIGQIGDLYVKVTTTNHTPTVTMHLCTFSSTPNNAAVWAPFQLGAAEIGG
jgi:hypothetical protein